MSEQATLSTGNMLPMVVCCSMEAKYPTDRQGFLPWVQHYVTQLCCFPCKYYFIWSLVQHLEKMQHCLCGTDMLTQPRQ